MSYRDEIRERFGGAASGGANDSAPSSNAASPVVPVPVPSTVETVQVLAKDPLAASSAISLNDMLVKMVEAGGSDLFLSAEAPPVVEVNGGLQHLADFPLMSGQMIKESIYQILTQRERKEFEETMDLDTSHAIENVSRFRVNVFRSKGEVSCVIRTIPEKIPTLEQLKMPEVLSEFCQYTQGLVLVTGPTGSGKSTTLAAMIDLINRTKAKHILTIEDPIEFVHTHKKGIVNQRRVGDNGDTKTFAAGLKYALRQAPKIILVGEMRDLETISLAVSAAETGHLVFGTLHTSSAEGTISRITDVFPANQQEQIRTQLSASLKAVVCQSLIKTADGKGRRAALEIMKVNDAVKSSIQRNKLANITSILQTGTSVGMQTMDYHLQKLVEAREITVDAALEKCHRREDLIRELGGEEKVDQLRRGAANSVGLSSPFGRGLR